ncbi:hypothetical protein [Roseibium sp.]|uniref:hypothetical protein n=1 Tax=Roseibium sp. TaxID=1936156 RepID=UPI0032630880
MPIRTFADIEALPNDEKLTDAEQQLLDNCKDGVPTVLGDGERPSRPSPERTIRADLLRYLILGGCDRCRVHDRGVLLRGAWVLGPLDLDFTRAKGVTQFWSCSFGQAIGARQAQFVELSLSNCHLRGLNAQGLGVAGSVLLDGLTSTGIMDINSAQIDGQLSFEGAELDGSGGVALSAQRLVVKEGLVWREVKSVKGFVDLTAAHLGDLVDDIGSWDKMADMSLIGMTYDSLIGPLGLEMRKAWLKKGAKFDGSFYPQPYQQLARFFRETGHRREVREILIEKEIQQRKAARKRWSDERHFRRDLRRFVLNASEDTARKLATSGAKAPEFSVTWLELSKQRFGRTEATKSRDPMVAEFLQQDFRNQLLWDNAKAVIRLFLNRSGDRIYRYVSGYGYKPGRSLLAMALLIAVMTVLAQVSWNMGDLAPNSDVIQISKGWQELAKTERRPSEAWIELYGQDYETFEPFFYAADVVIPIIDIGQTEAWTPSTERSWWGWSMFGVQKIFVILGWVVTAIAAASVTGMIRRDD